MPAIFGLFDLIALFYVLRSLQLTLIIWRERRALRHSPLSFRQKYLAEQASFFLAVPIGVLLHELGHALAVWGFGGQVLQFGYRVFWGFVIPFGSFNATQLWFISLAGTLASLLFGLSLWLLLRHSQTPALRYFGLRAFRFQTFFSLIYYPVFTLLGFEGDWATIYRFAATPVWSGLTAVSHAALLFLFWRGDRLGWFEMPAFADSAMAQEAAQLAAASSYDPQTQLRTIQLLRLGGAINRAKTAARRLLVQHPDNAMAYLEMALLLSNGRRQPPPAALKHIRQALALGLPNPAATAYAHQLLGSYSLEMGQQEEALRQLEQSLQLLPPEDDHAPQRATLHYLRSRAYRQLGQADLALAELQQAAAQPLEDPEDQAFFQQEVADFTRQQKGKRPFAPHRKA